MTPLSLSIVVPVYNEENRLSLAVDAIKGLLDKKVFSDLEIIFVNDGSTDRTLEVLKKIKDFPCRILSYEKNLGKGYAVRKGMLEACRSFVLMTDVDMSTPLSEIEKFIPHMTAGRDLIIGTRKNKHASVTLLQPWYRRNMGKVFTLLANLITGVRVSDFTCGFKCFSRDASSAIASATYINRWAYDAEILFVAARIFKFKIYEVPVRWANDPRTSVRLVKDTLRSFLDLSLMRFVWLWRRRLTKYEAPYRYTEN